MRSEARRKSAGSAFFMCLDLWGGWGCCMNWLVDRAGAGMRGGFNAIAILFSHIALNLPYFHEVLGEDLT
jgi:hypothetical protein